MSAPADAQSSLLSFVRLRMAILAGFIIIVAGVMGSSVLIVDSSQRRQAEAAVRAETDVTRAVFLDALQRRLQQMGNAVKLLGSDFAFKSVMATGDAGTVASYAQSLRSRIGAEAIWVTDKDGKLLADTSGRIPAGQSMNDSPSILAALDGQPSASMELLGGQLHEISAVPIDTPEMLGVLAAGFPLDDALAQEFKRLTGSEVSLAAGGRLVASTLPADERASLEANLSRLPVDGVGALDTASGRNLVLGTRISPLVTCYLQRSLDEALIPSRRLRRLLILTSLAGLALTALLGHFVVARVSTSIQALIEDLAQLNRFQSQFFSTVAHDVSNPLAACMGFGQMMLADAKEDGSKRTIQSLLRALGTLQFLISDLVDFASIESGKLRIVKTDMDLMPVLQDIRARMSVVAQTKQMTFQLAAPAALPRFQGDERRLAQVLQNLCSNALNYSRPGGAVILRAELLQDGVKLSVQDNGIGIAPQDLKKIFNRFFQAENARHHRGAGLGLGLKIAGEIVSAHGGAIAVASELDKGSVFFFTIPLIAAAAAAKPV